MPTYTYKCRDCNHEFEIKQKMSDNPLTTCNNCGNISLYKKITPSSVTFVGEGWMVNEKNTDSFQLHGNKGSLTVKRDKK